MVKLKVCKTINLKGEMFILDIHGNQEPFYSIIIVLLLNFIHVCYLNLILCLSKNNFLLFTEKFKKGAPLKTSKFDET